MKQSASTAHGFSERDEAFRLHVREFVASHLSDEYPALERRRLASSLTLLGRGFGTKSSIGKGGLLQPGPKNMAVQGGRLFNNTYFLMS